MAYTEVNVFILSSTAERENHGEVVLARRLSYTLEDQGRNMQSVMLDVFPMYEEVIQIR